VETGAFTIGEFEVLVDMHLKGDFTTFIRPSDFFDVLQSDWSIYVGNYVECLLLGHPVQARREGHIFSHDMGRLHQHKICNCLLFSNNWISLFEENIYGVQAATDRDILTSKPKTVMKLTRPDRKSKHSTKHMTVAYQRSFSGI